MGVSCKLPGIMTLDEIVSHSLFSPSLEKEEFVV